MIPCQPSEQLFMCLFGKIMELPDLWDHSNTPFEVLQLLSFNGCQIYNVPGTVEQTKWLVTLRTSHDGSLTKKRNVLNRLPSQFNSHACVSNPTRCEKIINFKWPNILNGIVKANISPLFEWCFRSLLQQMRLEGKVTPRQAYENLKKSKVNQCFFSDTDVSG